MKKSIVCAGCILALILPFLNGCEKDYLDSTDIQYTLSISDTVVWLNEPVTIRGTINQNLDIQVYQEDWTPENRIGIIKPPCDSIIWTPQKEGRIQILTQIIYKSGKSTEAGLMAGYRKITVKKRPEAQ